jgi:hypothetical protein
VIQVGLGAFATKRLRWLLRAVSVLPARHLGDVSLFHPEALQLASQDKRFMLARRNLFEPDSRRYDIVRAMSVFRISDRMTPDRIARGLRAIANSLAERGLLVTGQGGFDKDETDASIFQRTGQRMSHIRDIGRGSYNRDTILSLAPLS